MDAPNYIKVLSGVNNREKYMSFLGTIRRFNKIWKFENHKHQIETKTKS